MQKNMKQEMISGNDIFKRFIFFFIVDTTGPKMMVKKYITPRMQGKKMKVCILNKQPAL